MTTSMTLHAIAECLGVSVECNDRTITQVTVDSRQVRPGALYVAFVGERVDGHAFIDAAHAQGAVAALVSRPCPNSPIPVLLVDDVHEALKTLAPWWRRQCTATTVIALTGSCGKTTTKHVLSQLLAHHGPTHSTPKNQNNTLGVPLTLLNMQATDRFAVVEMGMDHFGEISECTRMALPDIAMITTIAEVHLEGVGDLAGVAKAKSEILEGLREDGAFVMLRDAPYFEDVVAQCQPTQTLVTFGEHEGATIRVSGIDTHAQGSVFTVHGPDGARYTAKTSLLGRHNVMNGVAALAVGQAVGMPLADLIEHLQAVSLPERRMTMMQAISSAGDALPGVQVMDDGYNANPTAMCAAIDTLMLFPHAHKVLVMGDMGELGVETERYHTEVGAYARVQGVHQLFAVGSLCAHGVRAFGEGGNHFETQAALLQALNAAMVAVAGEATSKDRMVVLVKGSLSSNMAAVIKQLTSA